MTADAQVVDLAAIAESEMAAREPLLRSAGLIVVGETQTVLVRADEHRLHEIVGNVLANSAKYCRAGDRVAVHSIRAGGPCGSTGGRRRAWDPR